MNDPDQPHPAPAPPWEPIPPELAGALFMLAVAVNAAWQNWDRIVALFGDSQG